MSVSSERQARPISRLMAGLTSLSLSLIQIGSLAASASLMGLTSAQTAAAANNGHVSQTSQTGNGAGNSDLSDLLPARADHTSPEARGLAEKILNAMGGFKNFKEFNDLPCRARGKIVQTSSISSVVNSFDCDILVKREKQRITIKFLGQPLTTVYDGKDCWTEQGDSILPSDKETARRIEEDIQHGFLLLESVNTPGTIMQVGKSAPIEGKDCDALVVWAADGLPTTFYADKEKHIIAASSYPGVDLEQGLKIEKSYHYSDYRPIAKTIQPFKVLEFSGNKKVSETIIDSVTADEKINDATFSMPKEIVPARLLAGPVTVPFEYASNEIIIVATVHGAREGDATDQAAKELRFIVDTGATQSILDKTTARALGTLKASNLAMTTGAGSIQTEAITIDKLSLGELALNNIPFATADLSTFGGAQSTRPAGLLGANILKRFLITIDYENQKITFADPTRVQIPEGAMVVKTSPSLGMAGMAVEGKLDGSEKVTFLIDTGAAFNNVSESKVKSLLAGPLANVGMLKGLDGKVVKTSSARFKYLDLDGLRIEKPVFSVAPQAVAGQLTTGIIHSKDLAILGNPILSHYTVSFDYRGQRLIFSQSKTQKAAEEFEKQLAAIKLDWLKTNNATAAAGELTTLADQAHNHDLPAMEAVLRAELALALCQKNGGSFTPDKLFAPIKPEDLVAESGEAARAKNTPPPSEKMFADSEAQLLTAYNLAGRCKDKTIEGRVLAAWGLMYASQDTDITYLNSAKQKLGKAVTLAPADADVLASSGYFLSRLESFKPNREANAAFNSARKTSQTAAQSAAKSGTIAAKQTKSRTSANQPPVAKVEGDKTIFTFKSPRDVGKWLVDQIVDQAIMVDPGNWLALWTKYERVKNQGKDSDMKAIAGQLKHYYPGININSYLR
ncbi:MAG: aspartyl protease family protein [Cyanobacteria bacterium REEB67]|nr:aspartyl protease family protein [Cyanobacteria bacterium REEB67]